jgi:hypothetical protein
VADLRCAANGCGQPIDLMPGAAGYLTVLHNGKQLAFHLRCTKLAIPVPDVPKPVPAATPRDLDRGMTDALDGLTAEERSLFDTATGAGV